MLRAVLAFGLAALAAPAFANSPDPRGCPRPASPDGGERERTKPLAVPPALRGVMSSSLYHYAIAAIGGGRICIDTSWMNDAETVATSPDGRFVTFGWRGYETYGYQLIDRAGRGKAHEIGARPVFSPSRLRFAAIDQTEAEFGTLSGFKVWQVAPAGVGEIGKVEDIPRMYDWRIDRWTGETCLNLSAVPFDEQQRDVAVGALRRDRFVAKPVGRAWWVLPATGANRCPG